MPLVGSFGALSCICMVHIRELASTTSESWSSSFHRGLREDQSGLIEINSVREGGREGRVKTTGVGVGGGVKYRVRLRAWAGRTDHTLQSDLSPVSTVSPLQLSVRVSTVTRPALSPSPPGRLWGEENFVSVTPPSSSLPPSLTTQHAGWLGCQTTVVAQDWSEISALL